MSRLSSLTLATTAVLALPAACRASDPLLSGYGGPGGGQQVLLGSHLLVGGGAGAPGASGSLRAPGSPLTGAERRGSGTSSASGRPGRGDHGSGATKGDGARGAAAPAEATAAPRPVAYPARAGDAGGLPLSASEVLAALLALGAVGGMGAWMRHAGTRGGDPGAQAPS